MRIYFIAIAAWLMMTQSAGRSHACDCVKGPPTQADIAKRAEAIFVGRPLSRSHSADGDRYELEVVRAWKGPRAGDRVTLVTPVSDCGFEFPLGMTMLLYVRGSVTENGIATFTVNYCGDNRVVNDHAKEEPLLGAPTSALTADQIAQCPCKATETSEAATAITGKVTGIRTTRDVTTYEIRSLRRLRGKRDKATTLMLSTPSVACGHDLKRGDNVLVFLESEPLAYGHILKAQSSRCDSAPVLSGQAAADASKKLRATAN